jgi:competence protein ComEA
MARLLDGGQVDPNTASLRLLESLPGIGPARAEAIVRERARQPFASTRALERVPGIGPRTREKLEPFLAVDPEADAG